MQVCGKCGIASYCSRACQSSAWKDGHKIACTSLESRYMEFQRSLKTVDDAHNSEDMGMAKYGIKLNDGVDYDVLQ